MERSDRPESWWQARAKLSQSPGKETLGNLYVEQQLSYAEIARRFEVSNVTVMRWLRAVGIPARSQSEATTLGRAKWTTTAEHKERLRENAEKARANITEASRKKQARSMRGKVPGNKGKSWTPEQRERYMAVFESDEYRRKQSERQRGENAPNWRGGKVPEEALWMQSWEWKKRRKECYERDNWTCRDCGIKCANKVRIAAHHIIPRRFGGTDELDNLLTLCGSCHRRREWKYRGAFIA